MFFRNLIIYRLTQAISFDGLADKLAAKPARAPASQELITYGFKAPFGKVEAAPLTLEAHGFILLATQKQERILPSAVVRDAVAEKIAAIELEQQRKVYKKERDQIKDEVVLNLLPRAFVRKTSTFAAIDPSRGLVFVDATSFKRAEDLLSTLREALGSLPVRPVSVKLQPAITMTNWLKLQCAPADFVVLDSATLNDTHEQGAKVTATRQDLTSEEIQHHLSAGKLATRLALAWGDKLSFVLSDDLTLKRLRFDDLLIDQAAQDGGDDLAGQFAASFTLMMLTFKQFMPELLEALGGEEVPTAF